MEGLWIAVFVLLGVAVGSFLNVCIDRLPNNKSIVYPPSSCTACQKRLSRMDLIPVLSYLWLRGRCRYCRVAIPRRVLWVELIGGITFALLYWHYGLSAELAVMVFYYCLFLVILVIDLENKLILNKVVYPAAIIALVISIFVPNLDITPGVVINTLAPQIDFAPGVINAIIGGAGGLIVFLVILIASRGGMGWGDVKMAALMGLVLGFPLVFVAIFLAVVSGGLVAGVLLLLKARDRKQGIPFGPFLSLGATATLLWGAEILDWYLGFF